MAYGGIGAWKDYVGYRGTGSLIQEMFANLLIMPRLLARVISDSKHLNCSTVD